MEGEGRAESYLQKDGTVMGRVHEPLSFAKRWMRIVAYFYTRVTSRCHGPETFPNIGPKSKYMRGRHPGDHTYRQAVPKQDIGLRDMPFFAMSSFLDPTYKLNAVAFSAGYGQPVIWRCVKKLEEDDRHCTRRLFFVIPDAGITDSSTQDSEKEYENFHQPKKGLRESGTANPVQF